MGLGRGLQPLGGREVPGLHGSDLQALGRSESRTVLVRGRCLFTAGRAHRALLFPPWSCGISVCTHVHAIQQARTCGSCPYKPACCCYFSVLWFLSNPPDVEISPQNQCIQKQELMRRLPFSFCFDSAFKFNVPQLKCESKRLTSRWQQTHHINA